MRARTPIHSFILSSRAWQIILALGVGLLLFQTSLIGLQAPSVVHLVLLGQLILLVAVCAMGLHLAAARRHTNAVFNNSPVVLFSMDANGQIIHINQTGADKLGYSRNDLVGRKLSDLVPAAQAEMLAGASGGQAILPGLLTNGSLDHMEFTLQTAEGGLLYGNLSARLVRGAGGRVLGADCVLVDETPRVGAEASLRQAQSTLHGQYCELPIAHFHCCPEGNYLRANPLLMALMGCENLEQLNALGHRELLRSMIGLLASEPQSLSSPPRKFWCRGGGLVDVQLSLTSRKTPAGNLFFEGVMLDATAMVSSRLDAQNSEAKFKTLFDHAPLALYSVDSQGLVTKANQRYLQMVGRQREEVLGLPALDHLLLNMPRRDFFLTELSKPRSTKPIDVRVRNSSGQILEGEMNYWATYDEDQKFQGATACILDVTLEHRLLDQRDQLMDELGERRKSAQR